MIFFNITTSLSIIFLALALINHMRNIRKELRRAKDDIAKLYSYNGRLDSEFSYSMKIAAEYCRYLSADKKDKNLRCTAFFNFLERQCEICISDKRHHHDVWGQIWPKNAPLKCALNSWVRVLVAHDQLIPPASWGYFMYREFYPNLVEFCKRENVHVADGSEPASEEE